MLTREFLDIAQRHGLCVLVGLSAEQHAGYLADPDNAPDIDELIRVKGLIRTPNQGLSHARNTGLAAAIGEIIAYTVHGLSPQGRRGS